MSIIYLLLWVVGCNEPETKAEPSKKSPLQLVEPPKKEPVNIPKMPMSGMVLQRELSQQECLQQFHECESNLSGQVFFPKFTHQIDPISDELRIKMTDRTWRKGCPVAISELALVRILHWNEKQEIQWGEIIVFAEQAANLVAVFAALYRHQFPMTSVKPMYLYEGSDDASMADNNTSAFNCRKVKNSARFSEHSYGQAVDINPRWNPWVKGSRVDPPTGKPYVDRSQNLPGMIKPDDLVVRSFREIGWKWGGTWRRVKDYQHFSVSGK